jgi:hypothetical protein
VGDALLDAFGFESDLPRVAVVSERVRHSDRLMAEVPTKIPELLEKYFGFPAVPHVVKLLQWMFEGGRIIANLPTDHAKSITSTFFFPILSLMENPDESHIICGANINDSKRRLQTIQRHIVANTPLSKQLIRDYPWIAKPSKEVESTGWGQTQLTVAGRSVNRPDPSVYAAAVGSNDVMQRRGKLIIDDAETEDHKHSKTKQEQLYEFVVHAGGRCFEDSHESKRPLAIALGTPMHQNSLYFQLESEEWRVLRMPCYTVPYITIKSYDSHQNRYGNNYLKDEYYLWPAKREKVEEMRKKETFAAFSLKYLLDPSAGDPTRLSFAQIKRLLGDGEFNPEGEWLTLTSIDPAGGSGHRQADYAGISVVRIRWPRDAKLPEVQLLEAIKSEQGMIEQIDLAAELAAQYECKIVLESDAIQGPLYRSVFQNRHPKAVILPFFTRSRKFDTEMGLTVIRTLVKDKLLKASADKLDSEGVQAFMREIRDLGSERAVDHLSCSVWFAVRWVYDQVRGYAGANLVGTMGGRGFGGSQPLNWKTWQR